MHIVATTEKVTFDTIKNRIKIYLACGFSLFNIKMLKKYMILFFYDLLSKLNNLSNQFPAIPTNLSTLFSYSIPFAHKPTYTIHS